MTKVARRSCPARLGERVLEGGRGKPRLIQDGKKDEAFAFLVDRTIPRATKFSPCWIVKKSARASACPLTINEVKSLAAADRNIAVAVMVLVVACPFGPGLVPARGGARPGGRPADLKRVALAGNQR